MTSFIFIENGSDFFWTKIFLCRIQHKNKWLHKKPKQDWQICLKFHMRWPAQCYDWPNFYHPKQPSVLSLQDFQSPSIYPWLVLCTHEQSLKIFATSPHSTCLLSVSQWYPAIRGHFHLTGALQCNPTRRRQCPEWNGRQWDLQLIWAWYMFLDIKSLDTVLVASPHSTCLLSVS